MHEFFSPRFIKFFFLPNQGPNSFYPSSQHFLWGPVLQTTANFSLSENHAPLPVVNWKWNAAEAAAAALQYMWSCYLLAVNVASWQKSKNLKSTFGDVVLWFCSWFSVILVITALIVVDESCAVQVHVFLSLHFFTSPFVSDVSSILLRINVIIVQLKDIWVLPQPSLLLNFFFNSTNI